MPPKKYIMPRKSLGGFLRGYIKAKDEQAWIESGRKYLPADLARDMGAGMDSVKLGRLIAADSGMEWDTAMLLVRFFGPVVLSHLEADPDTMRELEFRALWATLTPEQQRAEFERMKRIANQGENAIDGNTESA